MRIGRSPHELFSFLADLQVGARFLLRLPGYLHHPLTIEEAGQILRARLEHREADFLAVAQRAVYQIASSPYRKLLQLAGCDYGDLQRLVWQEGVEGALQKLLTKGVYLTVDEFKGRRPIVRGSTCLDLAPGLFQNPLSGFHVPTQTSGSRGAAAPLLYDFASIRDRAVNTYLTLEARGGRDWLKAVWGVPGGSVSLVLRYAAFGARPVRWFSQLDPATAGLHPRYRWSARALQWGSILSGAALPGPEYAPTEAPLGVARWIRQVLERGLVPHLWAFPSSAVRLCRAALRSGIELRGAQLTITGEPVTKARLAVLAQAGVEAVPDYGSADAGGFISYGCLAPHSPGEVHLFQDLHALIQPGSNCQVAGLPPRALLISSLRRTSPYILLNVSMGDQAEVGSRACGCPLQGLGWTTHLQTVRSFEKLTAAGMTFMDTDVVTVLEEVLPARFGGGPTDYQLIETDEDGLSRLVLLVHPSLGPLDEESLVNCFLSAIGGGSGVERVMELQWRQSKVLSVERRAPLATTSGKIQHLHLDRSGGC